MSWRRAIAAAAATALVLVALVVVLRSDGLPAVDAASSRATRWFVHQPSGRVVLADGYGGRALATLEVGAPGSQLTVAEGPAGAYVLNDDTAEVRQIDTAALRLGPPLGVSALGAGRAAAGVSAAGLVVVDPVGETASLLPPAGDQARFDVPTDPGGDVLIAPDGAVWTRVGGELVRTTPAASTRVSAGSADSLFSLVGSRPFVVDPEGRRARLGDGEWQSIPTGADPSEIVVQVAGPPADCGWVGADDDLWCISEGGIDERVSIGGLDIDGADRLAIAGHAAALIRRGPSAIVQFDWRSEEVLDEAPASIAGDAALDVRATVDLIWVDDVAGSFVWSVHPWGLESIPKNDASTLVLGDTGEILDEGELGPNPADGVDDRVASEPERQEPDNNGIDDPPVAVDDLVTARGGAPVSVAVTANDYDPDGEAIAVIGVGEADHGQVEIGTASTVVYNPDPGYAGVDQFEYTITDGDGTEASADVRIEILPSDAANLPPVGTPDLAETGPGTPVVIDVLLNDVDPERDSLRLGLFSPPVQADGVGTVTETVSRTGLPALEFVPVPGFEGTALFSYRPADVLGALGAEVEVRVEVASDDTENRAPFAAPDAVRLRRDTSTVVPVLFNDVDPDGDLLTLSVVEPLPDGLTVEVEGEQLSVIAGAGSDDLLPFQYEIDDGFGHQVRGSVLVAVIDEDDPNRPPVVTADTARAVVGTPLTLGVLANDTDPDGDTLTVVAVSQPDGNRGQATALGNDGLEFTPSALDQDDEQVYARFTYTVDDGNGHQVIGEVSIEVIPEPLPEPPFARDDSTFTFVDSPVTVDVLRNDGDPSGERPTLVGTPGCAAGGTAIVTADRRVQYTPPRGESGAFRCTYEVTNSQGLRDSASIIVSVRERSLANEPPVANPDTLTVAVGESGSVDVTDNDEDPDGDRTMLRVVSSSTPVRGSAERSGNRITFTAGDDTGTANIRYQVVDEDGAVVTGTLQVTIVDGENQPPTAGSTSRTVTAPSPPQQFDVVSLARDPDGGPEGLNLVGASDLTNTGSVSFADRIVTISPASDFVGTIRAEYTVADEDGARATGTVSLIVEPPLNRPPVAVDDSAEVSNGGSATVAVLNNDSDPDGDPLTMSILGGPDPALGSASTTGAGSIMFRAVPGASGTATVRYRISDGELADDAVLRLTVLACAESVPTTQSPFLQTGYQQAINVPLSSYVTNGTVTEVNGPPGYSGGVYTPPAGENGNVTITYTASNSCGQTSTGNVTIDVNQQPVPQPQALSLGKNEVRELSVANLAGDDEPLTIAGSTGAPSWVTTTASSVVIDPAATTPGGSYSWTTTVTDPGGLTANVPITATVVSEAPTAIDDLIDARSGSATVDIVANDTDPDDATATLRIQSIAGSVALSNGTSASITVAPDGRRITVNTTGAIGFGTVPYTVVDPTGATSSAVVTVVGPLPPPTTTTTTTSTTTTTTTTLPTPPTLPPPPTTPKPTFTTTTTTTTPGAGG